MLALVAENAPTKTILCAGAGSFEMAHVTMTEGLHLGAGDDVAEAILDNLDRLAEASGQLLPASSAAQAQHELKKAELRLDGGKPRCVKR